MATPSEPLSIDIGRSRLLALWLLAVHLLALAGLLLWPPAPGVTFGLLLFWAVSLMFSWWRHLAGGNPRRPLRLSVDGQGRWRVRWRNGHQQEVRLGRGYLVLPWLVVLNLRIGRRRRSLLLLPDNTDAEQLRRLRVRLLGYMDDFGSSAESGS